MVSTGPERLATIVDPAKAGAAGLERWLPKR
jgi:hypothetical protein